LLGLGWSPEMVRLVSDFARISRVNLGINLLQICDSYIFPNSVVLRYVSCDIRGNRLCLQSTSSVVLEGG
jgi:hypothetical protein